MKEDYNKKYHDLISIKQGFERAPVVTSIVIIVWITITIGLIFAALK